MAPAARAGARPGPRGTGRGIRLGAAVLAGLLAAPAARGLDPAAGEYDWGFLASSFADVNGDVRFRAAGPFVERTVSAAEDREFLAFRPAYCRLRDAPAERTIEEILWPIASAKSFREVFSWRVLVAMYRDEDGTDPDSPYRFWGLPLYFQGRDALGADYRAVFPFGGAIHEFLGMDHISFVLFPIWARNDIGEVKSQHWFWPLYARTEGHGIYRLRVFPFYGQAKHRDHYAKKFVAWPLWTSAVYAYPQSYGTGHMLFPLWGHIGLNNEQTWWILPPVFKFGRSDRQNTVYAPWPLVQFERGAVEKTYLFPVWGKKSLPGSHRTFFLWPIFHRARIDKGDTVYHRFAALPFLHSERYRARDPQADPPDRSRYLRLWPLLSYQREQDVSRLRMLDLWPSRRNGPVNRNLAPFWTLYDRTAAGGRLQSELLWGLYRHHRDTGGERYVSIFPLFAFRTGGAADRPARRWSILKGLLEYERSGEATSGRLLYLFRWGGEETSP